MDITKRDEDFLRGLRRPQHWKEDEARRAMSLLAASGETQAGFARRYGLRVSRLVWWKRRLARRPVEEVAAEVTSRRDFVELVPSYSGDEVAARLRVGAVEIELRRLDAAAARFVAELARLAETGACS